MTLTRRFVDTAVFKVVSSQCHHCKEINLKIEFLSFTIHQRMNCKIADTCFLITHRFSTFYVLILIHELKKKQVLYSRGRVIKARAVNIYG